MSEWVTTQTLINLGGTFNSASGKVYVDGYYSMTQTVYLSKMTAFRNFFAGNGVDSYLVASATLTQGSKTVAFGVGGKTSFYVPKDGRWSDWVSVADFSLPGYVTYTVAVANVAQKLPVAPTNPTVPVPVGAIEYVLPIEEMPVVDLDEEAGDYITSLPYSEYGQNLGDWDITADPEASVIYSSGMYIQIDRPTEPEHSANLSISILPFISHLPDKFTVEIITQCDSVPVSNDADFQLFLYTLDAAYIHGILASDAGIPGYEFLYKPLINALQKWRWEWDATNKDRISVNIFYDDQFIAKLVGALSAKAGSEGYPSPVAGIGLNFGNHYDTGQDLKLHIKSISITDGVSESRSLTEVTAESTITVDTNPTPGDTLTLKGSAGGEDIVFTFVESYPLNDYEIQIGTDTSETASNIAAAINNIEGAEFVASAEGNVVTITAYTQTEFSMETDSEGLALGAVTEIVPGFIDEEASVSTEFDATDGGKAVQEAATVSDAMDGLIDGLAESISASTEFDVPMDGITEEISVSTTFDGLIDYMGESDD